MPASLANSQATEGYEMRSSKPTLFRSVLRQHLWAAGITAAVLMLAMLIIADLLNIAARQRAMASELRSIESVDIGITQRVNTVSESQEGQRGMMLVDETGQWTSEDEARRGKPRHGHGERWDQAKTALAKGEWQGSGRLPWVSEPVVWASRVMYDPDGERVILVTWHKISAIRATALGTSYALIMSATLLAVAAGVGVAMRSSRKVTRLLDSIAESSTRMAAGDYQIHLPSQPVRELDRVSAAINRLAADLRAEHDRLVRLERLQRQFVADASHELRAPLTSMRVTIAAWLDGVLEPGEQGEALGRLQEQAEHLSHLMTNLLDLSRIESGRETVTMEEVDLGELAEEVSATFRRLSGAEIAVELAADFPRAWADGAAARRVLQNLLENARRFTPAEGSIRIWGVDEGRTVRLAVTDTGCGIAPDFLPRIWDRFARVSKSEAGNGDGSGLGLAIVKALVQAMGGEVGAESALGSGTTVWIVVSKSGQELSPA
jgi:signal transduction histidine kinase